MLFNCLGVFLVHFCFYTFNKPNNSELLLCMVMCVHMCCKVQFEQYNVCVYVVVCG